MGTNGVLITTLNQKDLVEASVCLSSFGIMNFRNSRIIGRQFESVLKWHE